MFTIPASPSPSYFAPGLVIISTFFISSAAIICKAVAISDVKKEEAFPFIKNLIFFEPLKLTSPSKSTVSKGAFLSTSEASFKPSFISFSAL